MTTSLTTEVQILHLKLGRRAPFAPSSRVVEPETGIAPEDGKGNLYILLELFGEEPKVLPRLYREVLNLIQETFYAVGGDGVAAITEAIQAAHAHLTTFNQEHEEQVEGGVTCLVVTSREVISAQAGPTILAVRSRAGLQWFSPLNHEDYVALGEDDILSVEIGRVKAHPGVVIVAMTSNWANYLEVPLMMAATDVPRAEAVADQMAGIGIDATEELTALIVTLEDPARAAALPASDDLLDEAGMDWEQVYDMPDAGKKARRGFSLGAVFGLGKKTPRPKVKTVSPARAKGAQKKPSRLPFVLGLIAFIILAVAAVTAGMWYYQNLQRQRLIAKFIEGAQIQFDQAQQLQDTELIRQSLTYARQQLDQARKISPDLPEIAQLEAQIRAFEAQINRVVGLVAGLDNPLVVFAGDSNPDTVFVNGLSVYVLDTGRNVFERYQLDDATGDRLDPDVENPKPLLRAGETVEGRSVGQLAHAVWAPSAGNRTVTGPLIMDQGIQLFGISEGLGPVNVPLANNEALQFVNGLYFYNGNIYLLDSVGGQLWRYRPSGANYMNDPEPYFPNETAVDLRSVIDVGIDGFVWLLYPNGSMLKFLSGVQEPFALEPIDPPLTQAVALWVNLAEGDLGRIFIADAATNRVVIFDKNGRLLAQLTPPDNSDALRDLTDIYVDELTNTIYLLTKTRLYQAPIPNLESGVFGP